MKTIKTLAAAAMFTLFAASFALAQSKPANAIDEKVLKTMLEGLGYDPEPVKLSGDRTGYNIKVSFKGYDATMFMQISPSGTFVWGTLNLATIKSEHYAEGSRLFKLLQLNQVHGPCHFYITPSGKMLCLTRGLFIKGITNKDLKDHIDGLLSVAEQTVEHWDTNKWGTPAPAPAPMPAPMTPPVSVLDSK